MTGSGKKLLNVKVRYVISEGNCVVSFPKKATKLIEGFMPYPLKWVKSNMGKQFHYKKTYFFSGLIVGTSWKTYFVAVAILVHSLNQWAWWSLLLELKYEFFMSSKVFRPMPSLPKKFLKTNFVPSNAKRTSNHTRKAARWPTLVLGKELFRNGRNTQYCSTLIVGVSGSLCAQIDFTRKFQATKCMVGGLFYTLPSIIICN